MFSMAVTCGLIFGDHQQRDRLKHSLPMLDFDYSPPYPNFDRSKVKGLVASLITLDSDNFDKSTALEITAGGRLYNVVVQDEKVGKDLLQNGQLRKRVTIIPLNKISARTLPQQVKLLEHLLEHFLTSSMNRNYNPRNGLQAIKYTLRCLLLDTTTMCLTPSPMSSEIH